MFFPRSNRRARGPILGTVALALALVCSSAGRAQEEEPALAEAREAFREGEAAFDAGDYERALERFRRAFASSPRAAIRFNVAVCLERLGRHREAVEEYQQAARSDELGEGDVARARELAAIARQELGVLEARGSPVGAGLMVDGTRLCALPCRLELDPGAHEVVALADDGRHSLPETVHVTRAGVTNVALEASIPPEPAGPDGTVLVPEPPPITERRGPSALTWIGVGLAAAGTGLAIGFGIHAQELEERYMSMPTPETRDQGLTSQTVANVGIGVAIAGAILLAIDLIFLARRPVDTGRAREGRDRSFARRSSP